MSRPRLLLAAALAGLLGAGCRDATVQRTKGKKPFVVRRVVVPHWSQNVFDWIRSLLDFT